MSRFSTELDARLVSASEKSGTQEWELLAPLIYDSDIAGKIEVPAGFVTDYASVIRIIPVAFAFFGDTAHRASVVHDYLYSTGKVTRSLADSVFLEAMESTGVPAWRRWPMYLAVRAFGAEHYRCALSSGEEVPGCDP